MAEVELKCACGKIRGRLHDVSRKTTSHMVCYCRDCRAFARFLGRDGLLDAWGGTEIFHVAPANLRLDAAETLACVRLSPKGLYRWHCDACKTPLGNTMTPSMPFVGLIRAFVDHPSPDEVFGPSRGPVHTKSAIDGGPPGREKALRVIAASAPLMIGWKLRRMGRPSPFFDDSDHVKVTPRVLTLEERRRFSD